MSNLNQCNFIGRLGKEVETRFMQNGNAVSSFSIAISEKWKDKNSGEQKEKTEWVRCVSFGKLADICSKYLSKGSLVYVSGKMSTSQYEKDGITRYSTEIIISDMKMLSPKKEQQQPMEKQGQGGGYGNYDQPQNNNQNQTPPPPDDDIPF